MNTAICGFHERRPNAEVTCSSSRIERSSRPNGERNIRRETQTNSARNAADRPSMIAEYPSVLMFAPPVICGTPNRPVSPSKSGW